MEVTICAYFTGLLSSPAAISPAVCAMSTMKMAPTLSAIRDETGDFVQAVGYGMIQDAGHVYRRTVCKMSAMGKVKSHECLSRFQACHHYGHVCLSSGMRLHVCVFRTEKLAQPVYGKLFYLVYDLAAAIVSGSRISFCIFVRADRTESVEHLFADIVFRGDKFDTGRLSFFFFLDQIENLKVLFHNILFLKAEQIYSFFDFSLPLHPEVFPNFLEFAGK